MPQLSLPRRCIPDCLIDIGQCLFPWKRVAGKDQIEIDGEARHIAHKKVDGCSTLQGEDAINKDYGRDLCQQPYRVEINLVHGLSTSRPSAERQPRAVRCRSAVPKD